MAPAGQPSMSSSSRASLYREIEQCPPATLRPILRNLCDRNADFAEALHRALCVDKRPKPQPQPAPSNTVIDLTEGPSSDGENLPAGSKKRKGAEEISAVTKKIK